jgi:hypothetical protein
MRSPRLFIGKSDKIFKIGMVRSKRPRFMGSLNMVGRLVIGVASLTLGVPVELEVI